MSFAKWGRIIKFLDDKRANIYNPIHTSSQIIISTNNLVYQKQLVFLKLLFNTNYTIHLKPTEKLCQST